MPNGELSQLEIIKEIHKDVRELRAEVRTVNEKKADKDDHDRLDDKVSKIKTRQDKQIGATAVVAALLGALGIYK